ncbi:MAG: PilZ domain-containing protein [Candidatus Omnitrophota bacterium]
MQERRGCRRYSVSFPAKAIITDTQQVFEGTVTDISFSGVRFICGQNIEDDRQLEVTLSIEDQELTLKARVIWSASFNDPNKVNHGLKVIGVMFDGDRKVLEDFFKKIQ